MPETRRAYAYQAQISQWFEWQRDHQVHFLVKREMQAQAILDNGHPVTQRLWYSTNERDEYDQVRYCSIERSLLQGDQRQVSACDQLPLVTNEKRRDHQRVQHASSQQF